MLKKNYSPIGRNKNSLHQEFIVKGVSTNVTTKICKTFCNHFINHPRNIHGSIPGSISHHLDQIEINERSMYFRNDTETDNIESFMHLDKGGGINEVSRKFLVTCRNYVSCYLKELCNLCITSGLHPNVFRFPQVTPFHM